MSRGSNLHEEAHRPRRPRSLAEGPVPSGLALRHAAVVLARPAHRPFGLTARVRGPRGCLAPAAPPSYAGHRSRRRRPSWPSPLTPPEPPPRSRSARAAPSRRICAVPLRPSRPTGCSPRGLAALVLLARVSPGSCAVAAAGPSGGTIFNTARHRPRRSPKLRRWPSAWRQLLARNRRCHYLPRDRLGERVVADHPLRRSSDR